MFDLTVTARRGRWVLTDDEEGELGDYATQAEALAAAGAFAQVDAEPRHVLIQENVGEWDEAVVEPLSFH
ncbi:hypothetical protein [Phenylobacterium sp.]|jgi:hypothetical protein|uniref:hypothetical protein n=1 Tax=Phenylobacterium sp. TaxID=1871053 RepID=UPI002F92BB7C